MSIDLHRVVVDVPDVGPGHLREALVGLALHLAEDLAHRPQRPPQRGAAPASPGGSPGWCPGSGAGGPGPPAPRAGLRRARGWGRPRPRPRRSASTPGSSRRCVAAASPCVRIRWRIGSHTSPGRLLEGQDRPVADEDAAPAPCAAMFSRSSQLADDDEQPRLEARRLRRRPAPSGRCGTWSTSSTARGWRWYFSARARMTPQVADAVHVDPADRRPVGPVPGDEAPAGPSPPRRRTCSARVVDAGDADGDGLPRRRDGARGARCPPPTPAPPS